MTLDVKNIHLVVHHKDKLFTVLDCPRNFGKAAKEGLKRTKIWRHTILQIWLRGAARNQRETRQRRGWNIWVQIPEWWRWHSIFEKRGWISPQKRFPLWKRNIRFNSRTVFIVIFNRWMLVKKIIAHRKGPPGWQKWTQTKLLDRDQDRDWSA